MLPSVFQTRRCPKGRLKCSALALCSEVLTFAPRGSPKRASTFGLIRKGDCNECSTRRRICRILVKAAGVCLGQGSA